MTPLFSRENRRGKQATSKHDNNWPAASRRITVPWLRLILCGKIIPQLGEAVGLATVEKTPCDCLNLMRKSTLHGTLQKAADFRSQLCAVL